MKRNILLCVAGATPQIITETLYDLTIQQGKHIDEIRVITTLDGRDKIMTGSIKGRGSAEESLLDLEHGKFFEFLRDYPQVGDIEFNEMKILLLRRRDGQTLEDIRTPEENELAGDQICEFVREICKDENTQIYASAAGGRKTMSIYLTLAMSLFGRAEDELSHVLVNADFETNPHFFYPTPTPKIIKLRDGREVSTETAEIYLAPIPFIRFRGISADNQKFAESKSYGKIVVEAQSYLDKDERKLPIEINLLTKEITRDTMTVKISDYELLLYILFAQNKTENYNDKDDGFVRLNQLKRVDFENAFSKIMKARGKNLKIDGSLRNTDWEFLLTLMEQVESRNEIDYEDFMNSLSRAIGRLNKKLRGFPTKYKITTLGKTRPKTYGLLVAKSQIIASPNIFG
jgi:CRISPR-associated protein (TIGR02584 family)